MSLTKWGSRISSAAGPVKTTTLAICITKILSLAQQRTTSLTKWDLQNFIRGRSSQDHQPGNLESKFCHWQAQQRLCALQNGVPEFRPRQTQSRPQTWKSGVQKFAAGLAKTTNLAICITKILSLAGPAKTMSLTKWSSKISSAADPVRPQTWQFGARNSFTGTS